MACCLLDLTVVRGDSYVIIGGVVVGASWYIGRLALGPTGEVILDVPILHEVLNVLASKNSQSFGRSPIPLPGTPLSLIRVRR